MNAQANNIVTFSAPSFTRQEWADKLARNTAQGVLGWPAALRAQPNLEEAIALLNDTLQAALAFEGIREGTFEHKRVETLIYNNVKTTLKQYVFDWLPEGMTIGVKKGVFALKKAAQKSLKELTEESKAEDRATLIEANAAPLAETEPTKSQELIEAQARVIAQAQALSDAQFQIEAQQKQIVALMAERDALRVRCESAENALEQAKAINNELLERNAKYEALIVAGRNNNKSRKASKQA